MKEFDQSKATELALSRKAFGRELDEKLSALYGDYVRDVVGQFKGQGPEIEVSQEMRDRIIEVSMFAEKVRTTSHKDWKGNMDKIPVSAMPMRVALQLTAIARGLGAIRMHEDEAKGPSPQFQDSDYRIIDWIGYSLANEENRAVLRALARIAFDASLTTTTVADIIGLDTSITRMILQNLSAVGVLLRAGDDSSLAWSFKKAEDHAIVRRIEGIEETAIIESRATSAEDHYQVEAEQQMAFEQFGL